MNVPDSKSGIRESVSGVRIPPSPPYQTLGLILLEGGPKADLYHMVVIHRCLHLTLWSVHASRQIHSLYYLSWLESFDQLRDKFDRVKEHAARKKKPGVKCVAALTVWMLPPASVTSALPSSLEIPSRPAINARMRPANSRITAISSSISTSGLASACCATDRLFA